MIRVLNFNITNEGRHLALLSWAKQQNLVDCGVCICMAMQDLAMKPRVELDNVPAILQYFDFELKLIRTFRYIIGTAIY